MPSPFRPDYGMAFLKRGVHRDFEANFYTIHIDHISRTGRDTFTTLLTTALDGEQYALSLDFTANILEDILEHAKPQTASRVRLWEQDLHSPMTIDLPEHITIGVRATLGEEQHAEKESYVPFIIQKIL